MSADCRSAGFGTRAVHAGAAPDPATGARATPIYMTNGFVFDGPEEAAEIFGMKRLGYSYSRGANPTNAVLEKRVADLEGGTMAVACASGQAALLVIMLCLLESGDEYVTATRQFGGSTGLMKRLHKRHGLKPVFADAHDPAALGAAITERTKAIFIESIVNPCGSVVDIAAISQVAHEHNVPLIVDNTLATPALIRPIEHGADIVWHSTSKFLSGHGQVIGGLIVDGGRFDWLGDARYPLIADAWSDYNDAVLARDYPRTAFGMCARLYGMRDLGPGLSPFNAFLTLQGVETLHLRMPLHCANAVAIAQFLNGHPAVRAVSHPSAIRPSELVERYCPQGPGSVFTFDLARGETAALHVLKRLKLISHLANIGETRTLAIHPASTTHRNMAPDQRLKAGIMPGTIRLSVGLEDVADITSDLDQALAGL